MVSHHPGRFYGLKYCGSIDIMNFNLSCYLARSRNQKVEYHWGEFPNGKSRPCQVS